MKRKPQSAKRKASSTLCQSHPNVDYKTAWGCPECVAEMRKRLAHIDMLSRHWNGKHLNTLNPIRCFKDINKLAKGKP